MRSHLRRAAALLSCLLLAIVLAPRSASAHALLVSSTPAAHATVDGHHLALILHFNSRVDGARSRFTLSTAADPVADHPFPLHPLSQPTPETLSTAVDLLPHGDFVLHWTVLASDGHISRGQLPFAVR
jgi:methionine-rich copper-binding protein CopC